MIEEKTEKVPCTAEGWAAKTVNLSRHRYGQYGPNYSANRTARITHVWWRKYTGWPIGHGQILHHANGCPDWHDWSKPRGKYDIHNLEFFPSHATHYLSRHNEEGGV